MFSHAHRTWWSQDCVIRNVSMPRTHYVRLHAERLEERLMMSADNSAAAVLLNSEPIAVTATSHSEAFLAAQDVQTVGISSDADGAQHQPQRFRSTAEFEAWLIEAAVTQWEHLFGASTYYSAYPWYYTSNDYLADGMDGDGHSSTNTQVAGVDEADLVETDGAYIYIIADQDLVIANAGTADELKVVSRVRLAERPVGMYLYGDRLAVVSSTRSLSGISTSPWATDVYYPYGHGSWRHTTTVTVFDVANRAEPRLVERSEMDGALITSRVVEDHLRIVLSNQVNLPAPISKRVFQPAHNNLTAQYVDSDDSIGYYGNYVYETYVYETKEEYVARVRRTIVGDITPRIRELNADGEVLSERRLVAARDIYRPDSLSDRSMATIATFDLAADKPGPAGTASVLTGGTTQVHATADGLYLFGQTHETYRAPSGIWAWSWEGRTTVWKFDVGNRAINLVATGQFEGSLLNQFAADEREGYLRVVAQQNSWRVRGHSVHVLRHNGSRLELVGSVGGIAPNENLYSVRFVGDRAYFVTFQVVDPLYAVDLSQPGRPVLVGELHIPGYSDYLQPIGEEHLLAIGRGADERTGQFEELQVSIFDVSDSTDPQLAHRYSFEGGRSTETPATGNRWVRGDGDHHAVSYFADAGIFAIPTFSTGAIINWWNGIQQTTTMGGELQVFRIDVDSGFTPLGNIEHDTLIQRSVRIGNHLYAISSSALTVHDLFDPEIDLGEVSLLPQPDSGYALILRQPDRKSTSSLQLLRVDESELQALVDLQVSNPGRRAYTPPARSAAFAKFTSSNRIDVNLIHALALDASSTLIANEPASVLDIETVRDENDAEGTRRATRSEALRRTPFRTVTTAVAPPVNSRA
jgi:uncharacterized secreted protein with C-terminal beta-propeller domain